MRLSTTTNHFASLGLAGLVVVVRVVVGVVVDANAPFAGEQG